MRGVAAQGRARRGCREGWERFPCGAEPQPRREISHFSSHLQPGIEAAMPREALGSRGASTHLTCRGWSLGASSWPRGSAARQQNPCGTAGAWCAPLPCATPCCALPLALSLGGLCLSPRPCLGSAPPVAFPPVSPASGFPQRFLLWPCRMSKFNSCVRDGLQLNSSEHADLHFNLWP